MILILAALIAAIATGIVSAQENLFERAIAPILSHHCVGCHNGEDAQGDLSLTNPTILVRDGFVVPGDSTASPLIDLITPHAGVARMPKDSDPLSNQQVKRIREWIQTGAKMDGKTRLAQPKIADLNWWSLKPIKPNALPLSSKTIDQQLNRKFAELRLSPLSEADPRTLLRRLSYDLTGLPPDPNAIDSFVSEYQTNPELTWSKYVDRLLTSSEFGEKWGQHWLDVARYAETHGYDKDKPRNHAWPYRDYVIRSFNADKPIGEFVREQIAGDTLAPNRSEGIQALGFLAAGPWDFIGHTEVGESKLDGRIAKHLDRDEMVTAVFNVFQSTTVQCAQCHNHKFDPITSEDYYRLHAIFAGIDRADRVHSGRTVQQEQRFARLNREIDDLQNVVRKLKDERQQREKSLTREFDSRIKKLKDGIELHAPAEHGFHSRIEKRKDVSKWVQIDLGGLQTIRRIELMACYDEFNSIGAGFGFPTRFHIEVCDGDSFSQDRSTRVFDRSKADFPNPGISPVLAEFPSVRARWIRVTATELAERKNDFIFALGEVAVFSQAGSNVAIDGTVSFSDSIPANARWSPKFLVDNRFYGNGIDRRLRENLGKLQLKRRERIASIPVSEELVRTESRLRELRDERDQIPPGQYVYSIASDFVPRSQFRPTRGNLRPIHCLQRGDLRSPGQRVSPGAPVLWRDAPRWQANSLEYDETSARAFLASYVTDRNNPLLWRSFANRIWQWTMGKPIVATPNDFGRMGMLPTHPMLLDALAASLRDDPGQSVKSLVRKLVMTQAYRRSSGTKSEQQQLLTNDTTDAENQFLWRANRRRLSAEEFRDTLLYVSGVLRLADRGGPSFQDFVIKQPQHSPHYEYDLFDPSDTSSHRRTIYRFVVRSQPQPMLTTLDCADPSISVPRRDESTTSLQALTQWNHRLVETMSKAFASRLKTAEHPIETACRLVWGRDGNEHEIELLRQAANRHGLESMCRVILNSSQLMYVD